MLVLLLQQLLLLDLLLLLLTLRLILLLLDGAFLLLLLIALVLLVLLPLLPRLPIGRLLIGLPLRFGYTLRPDNLRFRWLIVLVPLGLVLHRLPILLRQLPQILLLRLNRLLLDGRTRLAGLFVVRPVQLLLILVLVLVMA